MRPWFAASVVFSAFFLTACGSQGPAESDSESESESEAVVPPPAGAPAGTGDAWMAEVEARIRDAAHAFVPDGEAFSAEVPELGLVGHFDADGARIGLQDDELVVRTTTIGRGEGEAVLPGAPSLGACIEDMEEPGGDCVRRLEYGGAGLTEWWTSRAEGFEQGWTVEAAPPGGGPLVVSVAVEGAEVTVGEDTLWLQGDAGGLLTVSGLLAWDADGTPLPARFEATDEGFRVWVEDAGARYPVQIDPVYSTASTTLTGGATYDYFGYSVAGAGDVNGDGYDDVIVGASEYSTRTGRVYVYAGSASGVSSTAATTLTGGATSNKFGYSVAGAGDVNGDGYDDVIVGAYGYSSNTGRAYIYAGSASGVSTTAATTLTGGATNNYFGASVAGAGDVNGDGYDDVIVGAQGYSSNTGRADVYAGSASGVSTTAATTLTGGATNNYFGASVAGAGDVNGDGYDDVIVGAYFYASVTGRADVYAGSASGVSSTASTTLTGGATSDRLGVSVAGAGDVNGDGYDDVIVGAYGYSSFTGRAYVYAGYADADGDGYAATLDCDDADAAVNPGATEVCDAANTDEDCDGLSDDADPSATGQSTFYADSDADGYGGPTAGSYCDLPSGYLATSTDCDDSAAAINPGATEVCDASNTDEDCDGLADDSDASVSSSTKSSFYVDADGDSYGTTSSAKYCDLPASGYATLSTDCDDIAAAINPAAAEVCDAANTDEDCDGLADDSDASVSSSTQSSFYVDSDGDSYGTTSSTKYCDLPASGYATVSTDCDDSAAAINPGATEVCDASNTDEDCDGTADDSDASVSSSTQSSFYVDSDGDSYGTTSSTKFCDLPASGYATVNTDCDDSAAAINPGATEVCDASDTDEDCDGSAEDSDASVSASTQSSFYVDSDGDDYGTTTSAKYCDLPVSGYATLSTDCDDSAAAINPGATEVCDASNTDEDCDGKADDSDSSVAASGKSSFYVDSDGDDYGTTTSAKYCDLPASGYATVNTDCDDSAAAINPGATEVCDASNTDEDCDGTADDLDGSVSASTKSSFYVDADGDSYGTTTSAKYCDLPASGYATLNTDCDDSAAAINPAATEVCDAANTDEDCDGKADDSDASVAASGKSSFYVDSDGDDYGTTSSAKYCDLPASGYATVNTDCDDSAAAINLGATEVCDASNTDEDCDGNADDSDASVAASGKSSFYVDADGDSYGTTSSAKYCDLPASGYATVNTDCDDSAAAINPGATEVCDASDTDEDCDGSADDSDASVSSSSKRSFYVDADGDSYGTTTSAKYCDLPASGYATVSTDCDDSAAAINPGATEVCDAANTDEDCDGLADDSDSSVSASGKSSFYVDADGDSYGTTSSTKYCDLPASGYATVNTDCDDSAAAVNPGATEVCDASNTDEDCDGLADDSDSSVAASGKSSFYVDADGDDYGTTTSAKYCDLPSSGYATVNTDCDDSAAAVNPGATEVCDASNTDEDCDGTADDSDASVAASGKSSFYVDADGDSYGTTSSAKYCDLPASGYATVSTDCDDSAAAINPGATEVCDASDTDEDCDGSADDSDASVAASGKSSFYVDADGDSYGTTTSAKYCDLPASGYATVNTDCDDSAAAVNPGATEVCDAANTDEDCDGTADDSDASVSASGKSSFYVDADGDSYGTTSSAKYCDLPASGYATVNTDCDDSAAAVNPGATEVCDASNTDEDCDGVADNSDSSALATTKGTWYHDVDGDGYAGTSTAAFCDAPSRYFASSTDCLDSDSSVHPGAAELTADGTDQDCDGLELCYVDQDGDGYRIDSTTPSSSLDCSSSGLALASAPGGDCDDTSTLYNPGVAETDCTDPNDYNCDGSVGYTDADGDSYAACEECDDTDAEIHPGATEVCDAANQDEDCDGLIDDGDSSVDPSTTSTFYVDGDGDGYAGPTTASFCDLPATGYGTAEEDCDDGDAAVNPGAAEICDAADQDEDCDGSADDADSRVDTATYTGAYVDGDGDGYGAAGVTVSCDLLPGYTAVGGDCDDAASAVNPGATEVCDAADTDEDCDGLADDLDSSVSAGSTGTLYADLDADGFGDAASPIPACDAAVGVVEDDTDCDDTDPDVNPDAIEVAGDGIDQDCDAAELCYVDADEDGYRVDDTVSSLDLDCAGSGEASDTTPDGDCNDADTAFHPDASETDCADPSDYNCDGSVGYTDADGDGFAACEECDDGLFAVNPDAIEVCNGLDDNCDTSTDGADAVGAADWFADLDEDSFTNESDRVTACDPPEGYAMGSAEADCDDDDASVNPDAIELPADALDSDCDTIELCYVDADTDGYRPDTTSTVESADLSCEEAGEAWGDDPTGDCDDSDPGAYPGATEVAGDGIDQDCDGIDAPDDTGSTDDTAVSTDDTGDNTDDSGTDTNDTGANAEDGSSGGGKGCGCATPGGAASEAGWLGLLLGLTTLGLRRRRAA
jgi:hypothetical protein